MKHTITKQHVGYGIISLPFIVLFVLGACFIGVMEITGVYILTAIIFMIINYGVSLLE